MKKVTKKISLGLNEELIVVMPNGDRVELNSIDMSSHGMNHLSKVYVASDFTGADYKDSGFDTDRFDTKAGTVSISSSEGISSVFTHGLKGKRRIKKDINKQYTADDIKYGKFGTEFVNFIK